MKSFSVAIALTLAWASLGMAQSRPSDPLQPARDAKHKVDETEARLLHSLQEIEKLSNAQRPGDLRTEKLVIDEFRKNLIPALKKSASDLMKAADGAEKNFKLYQAAVQKAPSAFQVASNLFEQYADQEDDEFLKKHYLDMQQHALKWAKEMETRHTRLEAMYKELKDKMKFVEKSVVFLDRLDTFLDIYPDPDKGAEVQQYLQRLNNYIDQVRRTIEAFKNFSKSIEDPKSSGRQESQPQPKVTSLPESIQLIRRSKISETVQRHGRDAYYGITTQ